MQFFLCFKGFKGYEQFNMLITIMQSKAIK